MQHLTLNTRNSVRLDPLLLTPILRVQLRPVLSAGGGNFPGRGSAYRVDFVRGSGGAIFTFFRGQEPLSTNAIAMTQMGAEAIWPMLEQSWLQLSDTHPALLDTSHEGPPAMPQNTPWLATVLWPSFLLGTAREDLGFLGLIAACFGLLYGEDEAKE
jgi:hypothetical protein